MRKTQYMEELERNYNCGVARYLIDVNKNNMKKPAIFYRGNTITYESMFKKSFEFAASLKAMGIKKGMEIPMCLANCPETVYLILAASLIGAKINIFGNVFDKDYIKEIINGTDAKVLFVTDDMYEELKEIVPETNVEKTVMFSLTDSYPNHTNPYANFERYFNDSVNRIPHYQITDPSILDIDEFTALGRKCDSSIEEVSTLDDIFSITYSSGSTNSERPKAIMHRVKSFNAMGMAHNGYDTPKMKDLRVLVQIPTHSNTCIISSITDTLSQGCCCCMEYIYNQDFFAKSLLINKPNYAVATRSFWIAAFKKLNALSRFIKLPFLAVPMSVGEPTSPGEEKYFNKSLRRLKAGTDLIPLPISAITMSLAGGDCEHGGLFFNLFKALREKDPRRVFKKEPLGYSTYKMVEYAVLDKDGNHCEPYEYGTLVANSPTMMVGYKNNPKETARFFVKDADGKIWGTCNTYSYIDKDGGIHIKGRVPEKEDAIPTYVIVDEIQKDTKRVLSCEVVELENGSLVAHVEKQPDAHCSDRDFLYSIEARLAKSIPAELLEKIVYRIRDDENKYPLTACGKRNNKVLLAEGLENTYKPLSQTYITAGKNHIENVLLSKKMKMDKPN